MKMLKMSNPMWRVSEREAIELCKRQIDSMEHWARRLIDEKLRSKYGKDYFNAEVPQGQPLVKNEIKNRVETRRRDNPKRYPRKVDALTIEDLEYFFCRDDLYKGCFEEVFTPFFSGAPEIRSVLNRISSIRNGVAHCNPLSQHEIEQGICYANDFVEVFRNYYKMQGKAKEYNVPTFIALTDSLGRRLVRTDTLGSWEISDYMLGKGQTHSQQQTHLRSGDLYRLTLEVDASFPEKSYKISWKVTNGNFKTIKYGTGNIIEFKLNDSMVSWCPEITASLTAKHKWHRLANVQCDDYLVFRMSEVYPPVE